MFVVFSLEHVHVALRFPCGYCSANEAVSDPRFEKPTFDGFFFFQKKRRRGYLEDGHGCWKRSWSVECSLERAESNLVLLATGRKVGMTLFGLPALNASSHLISARSLTNEPKQQLNDQRAHAARFCRCSWVRGCVMHASTCAEDEIRACCALCVLFVSLVPSAANFFASLLFFLLSSFLQPTRLKRSLGKRPYKNPPCMNVCRRRWAGRCACGAEPRASCHRRQSKQRFRPWFRTSCLVCATWVVCRVF